MRARRCLSERYPREVRACSAPNAPEAERATFPCAWGAGLVVSAFVKSNPRASRLVAIARQTLVSRALIATTPRCLRHAKHAKTTAMLVRHKGNAKKECVATSKATFRRVISSPTAEKRAIPHYKLALAFVTTIIAIRRIANARPFPETANRAPIRTNASITRIATIRKRAADVRSKAKGAAIRSNAWGRSLATT